MDELTRTPGFGLLHDFRQRRPASQPDADYYAECLADTEEAEGLGYGSVWLSEHHCTWDGFLPSPLVVAAAVAARTRRMRIGTGILSLPLHHPLRVAEDAAVVDLVSGGRLVLGVGLGYAGYEFEAFGVERRLRPSLLEEGVAVLRTAWASGRTSFQGTRWRLPDLPFEPRPAGDIPIYVGATSAPGVDRAVRVGDGFISYCGKPGDFAGQYALFQRARAEHGRDGHRLPFVATGILHVHPDAERAWTEAAPAIAYLEQSMAGYVAGTVGPPPGPPRPGLLRRDDYLVGTPADVAERLVRLHRQVPYDQFAFWGRLPGLSHQQASDSMRRFAAEVAPVVREAVRSRQEAGR